MKDRRSDMRTDAALRVTITHPSFGTITTTTRDVSEGGTFITVDDSLKLPLGSVVTVQIMDSPEEMPVLRMRVVRLEKEGMGLSFMAPGEEGEEPSGDPSGAP